MQLTELSIKSQNVFVQHYIDGKEEMSSFFDYNIHNSGMWRERLNDVSARTFAREELADYLSSYHSKFDSAAMQASIEKIKDPSSVAVVGGQQAGLLTGPLYTIHKIISIIVFAKQQEEELKVPVIPLFWVAGEDHDLEEINYVHTSEQNSPVKKKLPQSYWKKTSAANTSLDQEKCAMWIDEVFASFEETDHTNTLIEHVKRCLRDSTTFTDFFEHLIAAMFQEEGLVLLNSGDPGIKKLETAMFQKILRLNGELANSVAEQQLLMNQTGYQPIIESGKDQANLFYEYETERFLIEKDNAGFIVRELELTWTEDELYIHMEENPERFSNNVVTRPLMQEYLIPTLAFIAGPGEVNYWGELKQAFGLMDFKMPPVVPRLNITIVERHIEKKLSERNISLKEAIEGGTKSQKDAYFESQIPEQFTELINNAKAEIETIHKNIRQEALKVDSSMAPLLQKNAAFIQDQLRFLERTVTKRIEEKEGYVLRDYEKIQNSIKPLLAPQERIWNIMYYLNRYGPKFFTTFKHLPFSFQNQHQVVKL